MRKGKKIEELDSRIESLAQELVSAYEELNLLYDLSNSLGSPLEFEKTVDLILSKALDMIEADKAAVLLLDDSGKKLDAMRRWNSGDRVGNDPAYEVNIEGTIFARVIHMKRGLIVNDITECRNGISPFIATKSLLCSLLQAKDKIIGVLTLGDKKGMEFTSSDLKLCTVLSSQAALIIENARLLQAYFEKKQIERELQVAQDIQKRLQPQTSPKLQGFDIAALSVPCIQVGGDYHDFIPLSNGRLGIVIGDVMGHGVGPALLMVAVRSAIHILSEETLEISDILSRVNNMFIKDLGEKQHLMTLFYGILDIKKRSLAYSNAGHDYPLVLRSSHSTFESLESTGTVMGIFENCSFGRSEVQLNLGDIVVFYTDGAVEVQGESEQQFGKERLCGLVRENRKLSAKNLIERIYAEVIAFSGSRLIKDDLVLIAMKVE